MTARAARRARIERIAAALLLLAGVALLVYPPAAQWHAALQLSEQGGAYSQQTADDSERLADLDSAAGYNGSLPAIAASDPLGGRVAAVGSPEYAEYLRQLGDGDPAAPMARLIIPAIGVDLPVLHGTDAATLEHSAGHLFGTSLPVGGPSTHAVITAHSGLAERSLFTRLHEMKPGDTFDLQVLGETLRYRVIGQQAVLPTDSSALAVQPGRDLVTLVTCTPIGVNSHRLLVTAERVPLDTPPQPERMPEVPGFPWWMVWGGAGAAIAVAYGVWPAKRKKQPESSA